MSLNTNIVHTARHLVHSHQVLSKNSAGNEPSLKELL